MNVPWYMQSPNPTTLFFWVICSIYGAHRFKPENRREWLIRFAESAFILGLIVLPFDTIWVIGQWLKFGDLYPNEMVLVITCLIRNVSAFIMCYILSYQTLNSEIINRKAFFNILWFFIFFVPFFTFAQNPSFTDWAYAFNFNYGTQRIMEAFIVGHLTGKLAITLVYRTLWQ